MFSRGIDKQNRAVMGLCKLRQVVIAIYGSSYCNLWQVCYESRKNVLHVLQQLKYFIANPDILWNYYKLSKKVVTSYNRY